MNFDQSTIQQLVSRRCVNYTTDSQRSWQSWWKNRDELNLGTSEKLRSSVLPLSAGLHLCLKQNFTQSCLSNVLIDTYEVLVQYDKWEHLKYSSLNNLLSSLMCHLTAAIYVLQYISFQSFLKSIHFRGDEGSWVRDASMKGSASSLIHILALGQDSSMYTAQQRLEDLVQKTMCLFLQISVERIARVREVICLTAYLTGL